MAANQKETQEICKRNSGFDLVEYYRNAYENFFTGLAAEVIIEQLGLTDILVQAGVIPTVPSHPALAHLSEEEQMRMDDHEQEVLIDTFEKSPSAADWDGDEWGRMIEEAHKAPRYLSVGLVIGRDGRETGYPLFEPDHYPRTRDAAALQEFFRSEFELPTQVHEEIFTQIGVIPYFEAAGVLEPPHFDQDQRTRAFRYLYIGALIGYFCPASGSPTFLGLLFRSLTNS